MLLLLLTANAISVRKCQNFLLFSDENAPNNFALTNFWFTTCESTYGICLTSLARGISSSSSGSPVTDGDAAGAGVEAGVEPAAGDSSGLDSARASSEESVESQSGFPFSSTRVAEQGREATEEPVAVEGIGLAAIEGDSSGVDSARREISYNFCEQCE